MSGVSPRDGGGAGPLPAPPAPWPWVGLALGAVALAVHAWPGAEALLAWERGTAAGQPWRLLTGHFVHWSHAHLAWDAATTVVLATACERRSRRGLVAVLVASGLAIPLAVGVALPDLTRYGGLSGIDCALFAWLAVDTLRAAQRADDRSAGLVGGALAAALLAKVAFEAATGHVLFVRELGPGVDPVPLAHAAGAAAGALCALATGGPGARRAFHGGTARPIDASGRAPVPAVGPAPRGARRGTPEAA